jgi:bifunctional ADP-heptose synthase (sugar kinase/adenylyltransferase)
MAEQNGPLNSWSVDVIQGTGTADTPNRYYPLVKIKDVLSTSAGEDVSADVQKVEQRFGYRNITTATTTLVKTGVGMLHSITVGATAAGAITIYDNTSAAGNIIGTLAASVAERTYTYDVAFAVGLTIVTAAASNITVSYR